MNALLLESPFPSFDLISADQVVPAIEAILKDNRAALISIKQAVDPNDLVQAHGWRQLV